MNLGYLTRIDAVTIILVALFVCMAASEIGRRR